MIRMAMMQEFVSWKTAMQNNGKLPSISAIENKLMVVEVSS